MKEVHGRTLTSIIKQHRRQTLSGLDSEASGAIDSRMPTRQPDSENPSPNTTETTALGTAAAPPPEQSAPVEDDTDWTEQRLMAVYQKVCEAVAYAHTRGVIHCDLKPENVMVGRFGEVVVMDWGVALLANSPAVLEANEQPVETRGFDAERARLVGGTPGYMSPEQMAGAIDQVGPPADVFALGVLLYQMFAGRRPYRGKRGQVIRMALRGEIPPMPVRPGSIFDEALWKIIVRALRPRPDERFADAVELSEVIARWRDGAIKREEALVFVERAEGLFPRIEAARSEAADIRVRARERLQTLEDETDLRAKSKVWSDFDRADERERDAALETVEAARLLRDALFHAPELPEARALLAQIHYQEHRHAERQRNYAEAARHELLLRAHDVGEYADYLKGEERLHIEFEKPRRVRLYRVRERNRQLTPQLVRAFPEDTKLDAVLPVGSYLIQLRDDDVVVNYPVLL
ncbi:MAG TPA: protein kinase, partial [Gammaproteobacteria bacterium]|nr:protein kinase [Gammaproteobacteria bacterium]